MQGQQRQIARLRTQLAQEKRKVAALQAETDERRNVRSSSSGAISPFSRRSTGLTILDDVFPLVLSPFRITEYNAYLDRWPDAIVRSTTASFRNLQETRSFEQVLDEYAEIYPQYRDRIFSFDPASSAEVLKDSSLVYTVFLRNARLFLDLVHRYDLPFAFTLYPGGGFQLNNEASDRSLREVLSSPNLRKVLVTQKVSNEYLLEKEYCDPTKIEFVYGGVFPSRYLADHSVVKRYYRKDKSTFDVCFVAHKYTERGLDKGYDVFVEVAKLLSKVHEDVRFHVVGPFDDLDIPVEEIKDRIRFYGSRPTEFFPEFYSGMDVILSPNAPFVLLPGAFDGFPTGGCIEAGLCGVAVLCTDPLNQNVAFKDGQEIVVVPHDAEAICEVVGRYYAEPEALYELASNGQGAFRRVFDLEAQMDPRLRVLSEAMGERPATPEQRDDWDAKRGPDAS